MGQRVLMARLGLMLLCRVVRVIPVRMELPMRLLEDRVKLVVMLRMV